MVKKKFLKTKPICEVTFQLPKAIEAESVSVVGSFNNWDATANPLKKTRGVWKTSIKLEKGQEFEYKFVVNGDEWHNDHDADKYVPNDVGGDNSVVVTHQD